MSRILGFADPHADVVAVVGGKGANLGRLTRAGFAVPTGFTVTADVYSEVLTSAGLDAAIRQLASDLDADDLTALDLATQRIRALVSDVEFPAEVADQIGQAYRDLGADRHVAVRSSGTAEDLAEASFAGLHDTFLDVRGADAVLQAVRDCWASMWTPRATSFRSSHGFDHSVAKMAVVVQVMLDPQIAGVMFTGNPTSTATDEVVINSSWGLGESIVSGAVTPDHYVVKVEPPPTAPSTSTLTFRVQDRQLGSKATEIVRDRDTGRGTLTRGVSPARRQAPTLSDDQAVELARLGIEVQSRYGGLPQDIEWAYQDGRFHLLQSRPITGVAFTWDADVHSWNGQFPDDDDILWTRAWADELHDGPHTPLFFSARCAGNYDRAYIHLNDVMGFPELRFVRRWKYYKAALYYNGSYERDYVAATGLPWLRRAMLSWVPEQYREDVLAAPFDYLRYAKAWARVLILEQHAADGNKLVAKWRNNPDKAGLSYQKLQELTDDELKTYIDHHVENEAAYTADVMPLFFMIIRDVAAQLAWIVQNWYTGDDAATVLPDLMSGALERTDTQRENIQLYNLAAIIRKDPGLSALLHSEDGPGFFAALEHTPAGRDFLVRYREFLDFAGHRGHAYREFAYPRRSEDPRIDHTMLKTLLTVENPRDPEEMEAEVNHRRDTAYRAVVRNLAAKPLGLVKAQLFKVLFNYYSRFSVVRDNERFDPTDVVTFAYKRGFVEMGRRMVQRGQLEGDRDFYFLSKEELFTLFDKDIDDDTLIRRKIASRAQAFQRYHDREATHPLYIRQNRPLAVDPGRGDDLRGLPTSPGTVTGTARIVKNLEQIGKIREGDVLVVNATDPGWTPVFLMISGLVVEAGGLLSHGSCLSREYGVPAVVLDNAMRLIPDGATVTVDGTTGQITIEGQPEPIEHTTMSESVGSEPVGQV